MAGEPPVLQRNASVAARCVNRTPSVLIACKWLIGNRASRGSVLRPPTNAQDKSVPPADRLQHRQHRPRTAERQAGGGHSAARREHGRSTPGGARPGSQTARCGLIPAGSQSEWRTGMAGMMEGKVAVVTGAGGGIGREIAIMMAAAGAKVIVADIGASLTGEGGSASPAEQTKALIQQKGGVAEIC